MRIAVFSDIHANLHALQAVWEDLERQKPDAVYCPGDLVGYGAYPNEVIDFLRQRQVPTVMGNYDEGVGFDLRDCGCAYIQEDDRRLGDLSLRWTQQHTTAEAKAYLQALPLQLRLEERSPRLLLVHGSPRKINEYVYEDRLPASLGHIAQGAEADLLVFGHTHLPYVKEVAGVLLVNDGSVGKPKDGDPRAAYALFDVGPKLRATIQRVSYDVDAAANAIRTSGLPTQFADILVEARG